MDNSNKFAMKFSIKKVAKRERKMALLVIFFFSRGVRENHQASHGEQNAVVLLIKRIGHDSARN